MMGPAYLVASSSSMTRYHLRRSDWSMGNSAFGRRHYAGGAALTEAEVRERVIKVVQNFHKVDPNAVKDKSHFINDLGLDSLDTVELVLALEDEFCLDIPEAEADKIQTVEDAVSYLVTNPAAK